MRCVTCGKRIHPAMKECPNCGAMVPAPESGSGTASPAIKGFDWKGVLTPHAPPPTFGGPDASRPSQPTQQPPQSAEPLDERFDEMEEGGTPTESAAPTAPKWTQYIFPALIILWFAFRIFGPEIKRYLSGAASPDRDVPAESSSRLPELRRLVLCDRIEQNQPVGARSSFSKSRDKQLTVFTAWAGDSGAEKILFNWKSPDGRELVGGQKVVRLPAAPRNFLVIGELPIGGFTEAGQWTVEVLVEADVVASYEFTIEP